MFTFDVSEVADGPEETINKEACEKRVPAGYPQWNLQWESIRWWETTRRYRKVSSSAGSYPQWQKQTMNRSQVRTPGRQRVCWSSSMLHPLRLWTIHKELEMTQWTPNPRVNIKGGLLLSRRPQEGCWVGGRGRLHPGQRIYRHRATVGPDPFRQGGILDLKDAGAALRNEVHLQTRCLGHRLRWALVTCGHRHLRWNTGHQQVRYPCHRAQEACEKEGPLLRLPTI